MSQTFLLLSSCAWALGGCVGSRGLLEVGGFLAAATNTSLRRGTEVTWIDRYVIIIFDIIFDRYVIIILVTFLTSFLASQTTCWTLSVGSNFANAVTSSLNVILKYLILIQVNKRKGKLGAP